MKRFIFKDDGLNGVKIVSYDFDLNDEGEEIATSKPHTRRIYPDADLTQEESEVKDYCEGIWSANLKKDYKAIKDAEKVKADEHQAREDAKPKPISAEVVVGDKTLTFTNGLLTKVN